VEKCAETPVGDTGLGLSAPDLLALLPYGKQFLFIDEFSEVDRSHVVARYRFRKEQSFYPAHFPGRPVTPGVILLEAMCQGGMVAQGIYLLASDTSPENAKKYCFLVTGSEVEWIKQVLPDTTVIVRSELLAWRMRRIRTRVKMFDEAGSVVAEAVILGMGVLRDASAAIDSQAGSSEKD
jgi:3-hydroxyacyl-[acyl-carrier-protein] dehydratase